jgi:TonB-dependent starch-binding outer membrane protein SusC
MKKFSFQVLLHVKHARKTLLIMKFTTALLIFGTLHLNATSYSQSKKFDLSLQSTSVRDVLLEIEKESQFRFFFSDNLNYLQKEIDLNVENSTVEDILNYVLKNSNLEYKVFEDNLIILTPNNTAEIQQQTVSGRITDKGGEPVIGANVMEKGTSNGTITDLNGRYSLRLGTENPALMISSVGFLSVEIPVEGRNQIDISLEEDIQSLEEVIVVGYGTQKKSDITGAISSVRMEELQKIPVASVDQALNGQTPGIQVVSNSGEPGGGASIRIRGVGTVNNAEPLYVIDGIPIDNSFNRYQTALTSINPSDIERIEILKDASALAIYGARAQNGVVMITTKRGQKGKLKLNLDVWTSLNVMEQNIEMLSGPDWAEYFQDGLNSVGLTIDSVSQAWLDDINSGSANPPTYNWIEEATRQAVSQSYQLGASGGNEYSVFSVSAGYMKQEGIFKNNYLERFSFLLNSDHQISKRLKFGNTLTISRVETETNGAGEPNQNNSPFIRRLMEMNPYKPIYNDTYYAGINDFAAPILDHSQVHPIWQILDRSRFRTDNRVLGSLYGEYKILEGLKFKSSFSIDVIHRNMNQHQGYNEIEGNANMEVGRSFVGKNYNEAKVWYLDNTLTYDKTFGKHSINLLLGTQAQQGTYQGFDIMGNNIVNNDFPFVSFTTQDLISGGDFYNRNSWLSYFGRVFYDFDSKYLITATVRRDGSSRFGRDKRFGTFPAASFGWRITNEEFMKDVPVLDNLMLRTSYGITGGESAGNYQYIGTLGTGTIYDYVFGQDVVVQGRTIARLPNEQLQWEETKQANIGIDAGILSNRIYFSLDYFNRVTDKMFLEFAPPLEAGTEENPSGNLGKITNSGLEFVINSVNLSGGELYWTTNFNFTFFNNVVDELANNNAPRFSNYNALGAEIINTTQVGYEVGALYGYVTDGIFQNWEEVYAHDYQNQQRDAAAETAAGEGSIIYDETSKNDVSFTAPGDIRFVDQNNDGIINESDKTIIGSTIPDFIWGMNNTFAYRGLELSIFIQGVHGVDIYNHLRRLQEGMNTAQAENMRVSVKDRWTSEGSSDDFPRLNVNDPNNNFRISDRWIEDGSYIRLKNVRIAYDLPSAWMESAKISQAQLYLNLTNLITITDYQGFDPEVGNRNPTRSETAGTDLGNYPLSKQFTLGLKLNF